MLSSGRQCVWWTKLAGSCGAEWWILIPRHCLGPCSTGAGSLRRLVWKAGQCWGRAISWCEPNVRSAIRCAEYCGRLATPWLARELAKVGFPVVCMDARAAADAVRSRRVKSDKADAHALAEMLRTGWYRTVYVKSEDSHRLKAIRLPSRQGTKKFAEAAHQAVRRDNMLHASAARGVGGDRRRDCAARRAAQGIGAALAGA